MRESAIYQKCMPAAKPFGQDVIDVLVVSGRQNNLLINMFVFSKVRTNTSTVAWKRHKIRWFVF